MLPEAQSLHQSVPRRTALEAKLFAADRRYKAWANYTGRKGALPGFCELDPSASWVYSPNNYKLIDAEQESFFWSSGPLGMIQHEDFWGLISRQVNVYRSDPVGTTTTSIILKDGRKVPTDVVFYGTG